MFYCRCSNCSCTATVLITQKIENRKVVPFDQLRENEDSNITLNWEELMEGNSNDNVKEEADESTEQRMVETEEISRGLESVILLVCLIMIVLGR